MVKRAEGWVYEPRFNRNQKDIFCAIRSKLPQPPQVSTSMNRRNMDLWCEYHKEHGHTLAHCRELKKVLDRLANEGKLGRFINRNQQYQPYRSRQGSYNNQGLDQNSNGKKEK